MRARTGPGSASASHARLRRASSPRGPRASSCHVSQLVIAADLVPDLPSAHPAHPARADRRFGHAFLAEPRTPGGGRNDGHDATANALFHQARGGVSPEAAEIDVETTARIEPGKLVA